MHFRTALALLTCALLLSCGSREGSDAQRSDDSRPGATADSGGRPSGQPGGERGGGRPGGRPEAQAAVPVEVAPVVRRDISAYIETNGVLEAENEVDIVSRMSGPIVDLRAEEGMLVARGQLLARIDDQDVRSNVEIARVALEEARLNWDRSKKLHEERLISPEEYEQAANRHETAQAQYENNRILLGYTEIRAPFSGRIINRYIDLAQQVSPGAALFRISDFDPLLCPIQVPERELPRLAVGQAAYLNVEAWEDERFPASVLRISPVVDAATGTVKVTLNVEPDERLRPGMFTRVFLETERRSESLVIPRTALSLDSLGDTVYVAADGTADRREVKLGFREGEYVEILGGLEEDERVVVIGQDGLSQGTPIQFLGPGSEGAEPSMPSPEQAARPLPHSGNSQGSPGTGERGEDPGRPMDRSQMTPEQIEKAREVMRARGLSEAEIDQRLEQRRNQEEDGGNRSPDED